LLSTWAANASSVQTRLVSSRSKSPGTDVSFNPASIALRRANTGSDKVPQRSKRTIDGQEARRAMRQRKFAVLYEYNLNFSWCHEIRIEDWLTLAPDAAHPTCTGGSGIAHTKIVVVRSRSP
jgi:hypothetical protein